MIADAFGQPMMGCGSQGKSQVLSQCADRRRLEIFFMHAHCHLISPEA
jgi:hypothetical protein